MAVSTSYTIPLDRASAAADMRRRVKAIFIGSIGNLVEWYDFYAYAAFALYFAGAFFPELIRSSSSSTPRSCSRADSSSGRLAAGCSATWRTATAAAKR